VHRRAGEKTTALLRATSPKLLIELATARSLRLVA
jgi:hypothetical protein